MVATQQRPVTGGAIARRPVTLAVIVGNRGFFPSHLSLKGRKTVLDLLANAGINVIITPEDATNAGSIESLAEARLCADLLRAHRDEIDGVLVTLPNFGDERAVSNALRWAELNVPVLIHAFPDDPQKMDLENRRDSFCGKMSLCNNLRQYGIPYTLTSLHTVDPNSQSFQDDLAFFTGVCRVVRGLRGARLGMMGARPAAFNTVRFSEKLLENAGISIETLDLSEVFGRIDRLADTDPAVLAKREAVAAYARTAKVPPETLIKLAKFGVVLDRWVEEQGLAATAVQCWTAMEEYFGVVPCTLMSMASNSLNPSACETDIVGALAMLALSLASGRPSAIVDWNNNYGDDPDKAVVFHCCNLPKHFFADVQMDYQAIIAGTVCRDNTYGTLVGRVKPGPMTFARFSTDDVKGRITGYVGEGEFTADPLTTFGGAGVVRIPRMQALLRHICENGFEHHVAANLSSVAGIVYEAATKYLGWEMYWHR